MGKLEHCEQFLAPTYEQFEESIIVPTVGVDDRFKNKNSGYYLPADAGNRFFSITVDMPDVKTKNIKIYVEQFGDLEAEREGKNNAKIDKGYISLEHHRGRFFKTISLPWEVHIQDVQISCSKEVLEINISNNK